MRQGNRHIYPVSRRQLLNHRWSFKIRWLWELDPFVWDKVVLKHFEVIYALLVSAPSLESLDILI